MTSTSVRRNANSDGILQNTETWVYTLTVTPPAQNAGTSHTNAASASGTDNENNTATGTRTQSTTHFPYTTLFRSQKVASVASVREGGVGGDQVTYTYYVTNTSP